MRNNRLVATYFRGFGVLWGRLLDVSIQKCFEFYVHVIRRFHIFNS